MVMVRVRARFRLEICKLGEQDFEIVQYGFCKLH